MKTTTTTSAARRAVFAATAALATFAALAADQTLTFSAASKPAALGTGGEVAFTYSGDKVTKIVANVAYGDTVYLRGDALAFGEGATIETAGLGDLVISNAISGTSGLLVTNTSSNTGWLDYTGELLCSNAWTTVFRSAHIGDFEIVSADMTQGRHTGLSNPQVMYPYWQETNDVGGVAHMMFQLQRYVSGAAATVVKCVKVEMRQAGDDVEARIPEAYYIATNETVNSSYLYNVVQGRDIVTLSREWEADPDESVYKMPVVRFAIRAPDGTPDSGYGVDQLLARRTDLPSVAFVNGTKDPTLGGDLKIAANAKARRVGVGAFNSPVSLDVDGVWEAGGHYTAQGATVKGANGVLSVVTDRAARADPYASLVAKYVPTNGVSSKTSEQGVGIDMPNGIGSYNLSHSFFDMTNCVGYMWGGSMPWKNASASPTSGYNVATPCHWKIETNNFYDAVGYVQMQSSNTTTMIRCVYLKFWQDTYNIRTAIDKVRYCYTSVGGYYGMDFDDPDMFTGDDKTGIKDITPTALKYNGPANPYSISNLVCRFTRPAEYLATLNASNGMSGAKLVVRGSAGDGRIAAGLNALDRLPLNGEVEIREGGSLNISAGSTGPNDKFQNQTTRIRVKKGGVLRIYAGTVQSSKGNKWGIFRNQRIDLDGGEFLPSWMMNPNSAHCYTYLNNLTLSNGGRVTGDVAVWAGNQPNSESGEWNVRGTEPSFFDSPVMFLDKSNGTYNEFRIRVSDVTGDAAADFTMTKAITANTGYTNVDIGKCGQGTMELDGTIALASGNYVNVYAGTVKLGASGVTDDSHQGFRLSGGAIESGDATTNTVGALKITARGGRIILGANSVLQFADCSGENWAAQPGSIVVENFAEKSLKFGSSGNGLTKAQRRMLTTPDGDKLYMNSSGYVTRIAPALAIYFN